jgi:SnoaL-like domain
MDVSERHNDLELRVAALEDRERIREVLSAYGFNADLGRATEYVNLFASEGVYDTGEVKIVGHGQLREMIASPTGHHKVSIEGPGSQHIVLNLFIRVNGDTAWAEGYSVVLVSRPEGFVAHTAGYNHWDFERSGADWVISLRRRTVVGGSEWGGETIRNYLTA